MNSKLAQLWREPALVIDSVETGLVFLVALGLHLSGGQQTDIVAAIIALAGVAKAFSTTPWPVSVFTDFGRAALVLAADFGLHWATPDKIAITVTFLGTILTVISRSQITPVYSATTAPHGAGSGPVTNEAGVKGETGYATVDFIGAFLVVVGVVLLLVDLLVKSVHLSIWVPVALIVVGVIVVALSGNRYHRT